MHCAYLEVERNPNHPLAEGPGLFTTCLCFPFFKNAHKWNCFGRAISTGTPHSSLRKQTVTPAEMP
jgi:hypothetical protein